MSTKSDALEELLAEMEHEEYIAARTQPAADHIDPMMREALDSMPPTWRDAVEQSFKGESVEALAKRLEIPEVAAGNLFRMARGRFGVLMRASRTLQKRLPVIISGDCVRIGRHTQVSFVRTLRIPEDGKAYPLPAGMGRLPLYRVEDYASKVPSKWLTDGGFFIPLYQREALYLEFAGVKWRPSILKVAVGRVNAVTGTPFDQHIRTQSQDYVVIPDQQWLDGINKGNGVVGQFVAMPLGQGYTIEEQVTDEAVHGGFQLMAYESREGLFPSESPEQSREKNDAYDERHPQAHDENEDGGSLNAQSAVRPDDLFGMGLAAGGSIKQKIITAQYGADSWDSETATPVCIHIVNSEVFQAITGLEPPESPITAYSYEKRGLPWFRKYEESTPGLPGAKVFRFIKSVLQIDQARGIAGVGAQKGLSITPEMIRQIHVPTVEEKIQELTKLIQTHSQASRFAACIRDCTALLDLAPNSSYAPLMRAHCYIQTGMHKLADMDASSVLDKNPSNVTAYIIRAQANISSGWHSQAASDAKAALALEPTNLHARELLRRAEEH